MIGQVADYHVRFGNHKLADTVPVRQDTMAEEPDLSDYLSSTESSYPLYPGGEAAMYLFIARRLEYPEQDRRNGTEGRVMLSLLVDSTGAVGEIKVVNSVSKSLDQAAMNVAQRLHFFPARKDGKPLTGMVTVPVIFKL